MRHLPATAAALILSLALASAVVAHPAPAPPQLDLLGPVPAEPCGPRTLQAATAGRAGAGPGSGPRRLDARGSNAVLPRLLVAPGVARLTRESGAVVEDIAREFLVRSVSPAGELAWLSTVSGGGSVRFVLFEQRFDDVPVLLGRLQVAVDAQGAVLAARVGELAPAPPAPSGPAERLVSEEAARQAGGAALDDPALAQAGAPGLDPSAEPRADRVLLATAAGAIRAWRVRGGAGLPGAATQEVVLAAADGRLLRREQRTFDAVEGARVVPVDPPRGREFRLFPDPVLRPSVHSPAGWCDANLSVGNNVAAVLDREGDYLTTPGQTSQALGNPEVFDDAYTGDPGADALLAITNAFWAFNDAHDRFRALGLDEAAGALQDDNFGRGGQDGDRIIALVQHASGTTQAAINRVQLGTSADGDTTYVQVGLFSDPADPGGPARRDGALDTDLLYHEYAHAVSTRLVGDDPACFGGAQPQAIAEGWSDFLAASFTDDPVFGGWTAFDAVTGHRRRSLDDNTFSLFNFCAGGCGRFDDGEIWSGALWDARREFRQRLGAELGTATLERVVVEAMRYTPCRPTFADARLALLVADTALNAGANRCALAAALAGRGIGASVVSSGPDDESPVPAFDLPPECNGGTSVSFDRGEYALDADGVLFVVEAGLPAGATVSVTSSGGDAEDLLLVGEPAGPAARAGLVIRPVAGAPVRGDGILQVAAGDVLTASRGAATGQASISDQVALSVVRHYVYGSCDDDRVPDFWILPGFLDAGEVANIVVTLGNGTADELQAATLTVTSLDPLVRVLPTATRALGAVGARSGTTPFEFEVEIRAEASPLVLAGRVAQIRFDLAARGRSGSVILPLTLNMDYQLDAGRSAFDNRLETFEPGSSTAGAWTHEVTRGTLDAWALEACGGTSGSRSIRQGAPGCASYPDGQVAATLLSPPLMSMPADGVAWRVTDYGWSHDVRLWTDPANPYCDADMVGVFATSDPATLPYDDAGNVYAYGPQRVFLFNDNTNGHAPGGPWYYNRGPQAVIPGVPYDQLRLAFVFWGDVFDCGFETSNVGHYRLDDVRFTYDVVRTVPETAPCALDCVLMTALSVEPSTVVCAGEPLTLRAEPTETSGCAGTVYLVYIEDGQDISGAVTATTFDVPGGALEDVIYAVYAWCEGTPNCDDYRQVRVDSAAAPGVGGPAPGSLRVAREGSDVLLAWQGAAAPPTYGVYRAGSRAELLGGVAAWPLRAAVDTEGPDGEGSERLVGEAAAAGSWFYLVQGRDACTDVPRVP